MASGTAPSGYGDAGGRSKYPSLLVKQDLAKLGKDAESRRAALSSLRTIVEDHLHGAALSRFLDQVEESTEGRSHAALLVGDLARAHGARLLPHIPRLLQILTHSLVASAAHHGLQSDCAKAVSAIAKHCASTPASAEHVLRRLCVPLIALLPHKVELLSAGAAACLGNLVESETWKFAAAPLVSKLCLKGAMALGSRSAQTVQHMSLLRSLACANASALAQFSVPLIRLLNREILLSPCASWQLRLAAIHLLESLLKAVEQATLLSSQLGASLQTLAKCRLDKMPHIRKAAMNALRTADTLVAKGATNNEPRKPTTEDLSQLQSQTEPSSPLRHSLDSLCSVDELFKPTFSSPRSQRSSCHAILLSPHALADQLPPASPSSKQLRLQALSSASSPAHVTTDDSDYFCAYFDTKENVSCRKIVHHIHDTATGSATPPSSPSRNTSKPAASPLPLPTVLHDCSGPAKKNVSPQAQNTTAGSVTRQVTVLDTHAELLASCERNLTITTTTAESGDSHQDREKARVATSYASGSKSEDDIEPAETYSKSQIEHSRTASNYASESKLEGDIDPPDKYSKSRIEHIFTEQQMQAMEDLKGFSDRLLEMREQEAEEAEMRRKESEDTRNVEQRQESVELNGTPDTTDHPEQQNEKAAEECLEDQTSSHHETKDDLAGKEEEAAETSSGEWSVRDNPIADAQMDHQRPVPDLASVGCGTKQDPISAGNDSRVGPSMEATELEDTSVSGQTCDQEKSILEDSCTSEDQCVAADDDLDDDEILESCDEDEILEAGGEEFLSPPSSLAEIDVKENGLSEIRLCKAPPASLRSIIMRGTACVVPIAIVSMAKLFNLGSSSQSADSVHIFVPPT